MGRGLLATTAADLMAAVSAAPIELVDVVAVEGVEEVGGGVVAGVSS